MNYTTMIPKIIHQTWKDEQIPGEWIPYVDKVKRLNSGWTYKLWTDEAMQKFVEDEFPDFLERYLGFSRNVMRADAFRYLIMYKIGGVYLDLDYEVLKPFDFKDYRVVLPHNRQI
ncbi:glycosyltransferase family 32 protein [Mangrovibacterium diazotrophicum]|uniref:Glycosyl transferase-like sugar-binding protein n=1 Tax=Mangrovibacterium diazotrophicum TaxID=1261403 RepID=A0A419W8B5_9BACT|nr:glycosyltransferase [Mangrovibacterium diazotrophicum]RKD91694.1 glycosyl transferase-like sugar-binding protein [Mangrovibacterium diazotrophicum]